MASCLAIAAAGGNWSGGGEGGIGLNLQGTNGRILKINEVSLSKAKYIRKGKTD